MTFARDQDAVAWLGFCECEFDGSLSVRFDMETGKAVRKSGDDFFDDPMRFFGAGVIAGDDGKVGMSRGLAKQRPLGTITIATGSEDAENSAGRQ